MSKKAKLALLAMVLAPTLFSGGCNLNSLHTIFIHASDFTQFWAALRTLGFA